jgi:hypothetical protein
MYITIPNNTVEHYKHMQASHNCITTFTLELQEKFYLYSKAMQIML